MAAPDNLGRGVFWWEPMFRGRGFFDDETHKAKPIVEAFGQAGLLVPHGGIFLSDPPYQISFTQRRANPAQGERKFLVSIHRNIRCCGI